MEWMGKGIHVTDGSLDKVQEEVRSGQTSLRRMSSWYSALN